MSMCATSKHCCKIYNLVYKEVVVEDQEWIIASVKTC